MIPGANSAFLGLNPQLSSSWINIAWWVLPLLVYGVVILWAMVELIRNKSLDLGPKIGLSILVIFAPFIGSVLTVVLVRMHSRSPGDRGHELGAPTH